MTIAGWNPLMRVACASSAAMLACLPPGPPERR